MIEINGKYNTAKIFTDNIDEGAMAQIIELCNQELGYKEFVTPHGVGRLMSRRQAKEAISLEEFEKSMEGIYSTTVNKSTLDGCALAYKPMDEIINNIQDTADVIDIIKPIYNFKAGE